MRALVLIALVAATLNGCAGGAGVAGASGPGSGEAPHGAAVGAVEVLRLF